MLGSTVDTLTKVMTLISGSVPKVLMAIAVL
jgi:hypothetical protein